MSEKMDRSGNFVAEKIAAGEGAFLSPALEQGSKPEWGRQTTMHAVAFLRTRCLTG